MNSAFFYSINIIVIITFTVPLLFSSFSSSFVVTVHTKNNHNIRERQQTEKERSN